MFQDTLPYLNRAEAVAYQTKSVELTLAELRKLGLDDFGLFMISLPNPEYPAMSRILPAMASDEIQTKWTGASGTVLLQQTLSFVRILENNFARYQRKSLHGATILDFGCGYGRILRMMYYYSDPDHLWGVDAWDRSLATMREVNMLGNFAQSENVPTSLPVGDTTFDLVFALSVFTHLSPRAAAACLSAVRRHVNNKGLFILTIRPVEFWTFIDGLRKTDHRSRLIDEHNRSGFAYLPHAGSEGETYGDSSMDLRCFEGNGWTVLGYDRSILDPYQTIVILRAV